MQAARDAVSGAVEWVAREHGASAPFDAEEAGPAARDTVDAVDVRRGGLENDLQTEATT